MRDRRACERRVYRLAVLLSGNPVAAATVIKAVLNAQPNIASLDSAHMDRLTVLRSREIAPAMIVDDRVPPEAAKALAGLTPQQREAWVFVHVYKLVVREAARAMDCSVTAITNHLVQAQESMERTLAGSESPMTQEEAAAVLRGWSMAIDVPAFYRAEEARRRRFRWLLMVIGVLVVVAGIVGIAVLWQHLSAADAAAPR